MSLAGLLDGKTAIVTGGANGIGAAVTRIYCRSGAQVFVLDRDAAAGEALVTEVAESGHGQAIFLRCDASEPRELEVAISSAARHSLRIDCLVNNVGAHPPHLPIDEISVESFEELLRLNLTSYFAAAKYALPHLRAVAGSIVNIGSLVSRIGQEWSAAYVATKGGVSALTRALAIDEARHGVRVNAVLPGVVRTPAHAAYAESRLDMDTARGGVDSWQWLGRIAEAGEVASVCLFLASELSSFITGAEIVVSGGAELGYGTKQPLTPTSGEMCRS
jgi:NAD(P)-dependent dehydrogenase (short-subunit alcohol dehydrogenase family)